MSEVLGIIDALLLNFQLRIMHFWHSYWFTLSISVTSSILYFDLIWKTITPSVAKLKVFRMEAKFHYA